VAERLAPPFGVFIHESVRAFGMTNSKHVTMVLWKWWQTNEDAYKLARALLPSLNEYYDWCSVHPISSDYAPERVSAHRAMAHEYFSEFRSELTSEMSQNGPSEQAIASLRARRQRRTRIHEPTLRASKPRATDPAGQADRLKEKLGLTDQEYSSIKMFLINRYEKLLAIRSDKTLTKPQAASKCRAIIRDSDAQIEPFLNEDQKKFLTSRQRKSTD
jgi:hypothetical protein